jgi:hypothetical protein
MSVTQNQSYLFVSAGRIEKMSITFQYPTVILPYMFASLHLRLEK